MMKKYRLKKWVVYLLRAILLLSFLVMISEGENLTELIISHLIAGAVFFTSSIILINDIEKEER